MIGLKIIYLANIIVAGWVGILSLFFPSKAQISVFENRVAYSEAIRMTGALWTGIFLLSILGLFFPVKMSLILLFQVIYKGIWLLAVALPAIIKRKPFPGGMAICFVIWVVVLPMIIPWNYFLS